MRTTLRLVAACALAAAGISAALLLGAATPADAGEKAMPVRMAEAEQAITIMGTRLDAVEGQVLTLSGENFGARIGALEGAVADLRAELAAARQENADLRAQLGARIDAEVAKLQAADAALGARIDAVSASLDAKIAETNARLQAAIEAGDQALQAQLDDQRSDLQAMAAQLQSHANRLDSLQAQVTANRNEYTAGFGAVHDRITAVHEHVLGQIAALDARLDALEAG